MELYAGLWWNASPGWNSPLGLWQGDDYYGDGRVGVGLFAAPNGGIYLGVSVYNLGADNTGAENSYSPASTQTTILFGNTPGRNYPITGGNWYHLEFYLRTQSTLGARDGIIRWWVNGTLVGDYTNLDLRNLGTTMTASPGANFGPGSSVSYDHFYLSGPNRNPQQVTDLTATQATDRTVTLSFMGVEDGTGQTPSYDVRFAPAPISWGSAATVQGTCASIHGYRGPPPLTCQVDGLSPGTRYEFQLVAYRGTLNQDAVFSPLSNLASATTGETPNAVGSVNDLRITRGFSNAVGIMFTTTDDGYGHPVHYDVRYAPTPRSWGSAQSATLGPCRTPLEGEPQGSGQFCAILGLSPGTTYEFQLVPYRGTLNQDAVFGPLSNVATAMTPTSASPVGTATLGAGSATSTTVGLNIADVSSSSGQPLAYEVRYAPAPMSWGSAATVATGSCSNVTGNTYSNGNVQNGTLQCVVEGLQPNTTYDFQIVAYRGVLNQNAVFGGLSNVVTVHTP
jgi:hypothetical protein